MGKKNKGPESLLVMKYLNRIQAFGKPLGFSEIQLVEVDDRKNSSSKDYISFIQEALNKNRKGIRVVALDSKGKLFSSESFSEVLSKFVGERVKEIFFSHWWIKWHSKRNFEGCRYFDFVWKINISTFIDESNFIGTDL